MTHDKSILFVHNGTRMGGAPRALFNIICASVDAGYDSYVACLPCPETAKRFQTAGAKIIPLDSLPRFTNTTTEKYIIGSDKYNAERKAAKEYNQKWRSILKELGPFSLVVINSVVLCDLIQPSLAEGCKVIQIVRETSEKGPELDVVRKLLNSSNSVIFISEYDRDLYALENCRTYVVPDFADPNLYDSSPDEQEMIRNRYDIDSNDKVVLYTGGNSRIKGPDILLKSLLNVKITNGLVLIYAGYSNYKSRSGIKMVLKYILAVLGANKYYYEKLIVLKYILGKKMKVIYIGFTPNIEMYYKIADICLVPYSVPHQAMPIFEAGMAGIPCIASRFKCYEHEMEDGKNGYLLPSDKPREWARAIESLVENDALRKTMGEYNKKKACERHNMQDNISKLVNMYLEMIQ